MLFFTGCDELQLFGCCMSGLCVLLCCGWLGLIPVSIVCNCCIASNLSVELCILYGYRACMSSFVVVTIFLPMWQLGEECDVEKLLCLWYSQCLCCPWLLCNTCNVIRWKQCMLPTWHISPMFCSVIVLCRLNILFLAVPWISLCADRFGFFGIGKGGWV